MSPPPPSSRRGSSRPPRHRGGDASPRPSRTAAGSRSPGALARLDAACHGAGSKPVFALAAAYAALYLVICGIKLHYFLYKDIDLPIFAQALEGFWRGTTFGSIRGMSWLGDHSSLILLPLAPLWALAPHPFTLLAVQTLALALGAWPVFRIARRTLPAGALPLAAVALYLLYPAVGYSNLFEFHPETLATTALLATLDAFLAGRLTATLIWATVALSCREDVALPVLGLAALALARGRPRRAAFTAGLAGLAIAALALTFLWLKPVFNAGQAEYGRMYGQWGATPLAALRQLLTHPVEAVSALFNSPGNPADTTIKREYWLHLFLPVAGLSLLAPALLLPALPILLEHLWSERRHQHTIVFHYAALLVPFVIAAAVLGLRRAADWLGVAEAGGARAGRGVALGAVAVLVALGCNLMFGPVVGRQILQRAPRNEAIWPPDYDRTFTPHRERMLKRVPPDGGVVAGFEFLSRFTRRTEVHSIHHVLTGRYTYSDRPFPPLSNIHALIADMAVQIPNLRFDSGERMRGLLARNDLHPVDAAGSTLLYLRGARDTVELMRFERPQPDSVAQFVADGQLAFMSAEPLPERVPEGGLLTMRTRWKRVGADSWNGLLSLFAFKVKGW